MIGSEDLLTLHFLVVFKIKLGIELLRDASPSSTMWAVREGSPQPEKFPPHYLRVEHRRMQLH